MCERRALGRYRAYLGSLDRGTHTGLGKHTIQLTKGVTNVSLRRRRWLNPTLTWQPESQRYTRFEQKAVLTWTARTVALHTVRAKSIPGIAP